MGVDRGHCSSFISLRSLLKFHFPVHVIPVAAALWRRTTSTSQASDMDHTDIHTVDGRNPAPVDRWFIPLSIRFQPSKAVQDFFHPQYGMTCTYLYNMGAYGDVNADFTVLPLYKYIVCIYICSLMLCSINIIDMNVDFISIIWGMWIWWGPPHCHVSVVAYHLACWQFTPKAWVTEKTMDCDNVI